MMRITQARAQIMNKAITMMRRILMINYHHGQNHGEDDHDRDYSTPAVSDNQLSFPWLEAKGGQKEIEEV